MTVHQLPGRRRPAPRSTRRDQLDEAAYLVLVTAATAVWLVFLGKQLAAFLRHL